MEFRNHLGTVVHRRLPSPFLTLAPEEQSWYNCWKFQQRFPKYFMYAPLPFRRLLAVLLWPFALILAGIIVTRGVPSTPGDWLRAISSAVSIWALALIVLGGSSKWWSPWRLCWQAV